MRLNSLTEVSTESTWHFKMTDLQREKDQLFFLLLLWSIERVGWSRAANRYYIPTVQLYWVENWTPLDVLTETRKEWWPSSKFTKESSRPAQSSKFLWSNCSVLPPPIHPPS
jgi:hypothetical protein